MKNNICKKLFNKKGILYSVLAFVVIAALLIGFSRAWFYNRMDMETLMTVSPPAKISILGPGGSEMTSLDMSYTDADKAEDSTVTIRRVICVQSEAEYHQLEIAHTTNLKNLTFNLYRAESSSSDEENEKKITDKGYTYKYGSTPISGSYINYGGEKNGYKYANQDKHEKNFDAYGNVQLHAEPLYWKVTDNLSANKNSEDTVVIDGEDNYRTYYVCEISWTEEKEKETDIFYILAKTAS